MLHCENPTHTMTNTLRSSSCILCGVALLVCMSFFSATAAAPSEQRSPEKPVDSYTITQRGDGYRVNISYPYLGIPVADAEIAIWARDQAATFTGSVKLFSPPIPYELAITHETFVASSKVTSVIFFISTWMGGAHPEPGLATFIYTRKDGRRLSYSDIFMNTEGFFEALSAFCREDLAKQLGERGVQSMLEAGTTPEVVNFDLFVLTRDGLRIYFPPYQAAPYSEGYLSVSIPLSKLSKFNPKTLFWDKD